MTSTASNEMEGLTRAAECLKVLAHPHRLLMLRALRDGEHTVGELAELCGIASHAASQHLRLLMRCGLLTLERRGREIYYAIAEPHLESLLQCIESRFLSEKPVRRTARTARR